ncbi:GNAT family N-acetyltransferase [Allokutzneria albata]|uniref:Protein N-acetyltransferase, RimJ/RimL family n=1 Tax=Allokutzneria albata TaxID=211114 RepID=A0A1H0BAK0_ALLAB|nr:GNAT family N-acetyltransferase [Allokutzneria albata]SDN42675.1 Protein N-acetyltransferase, RimJ/RimL family [Allokutzneria albata]
MEPIEINAGHHYLRALRADDRLDDRPALVSAFADEEMRRWVYHYSVPDLEAAGRYVALRTREWADDERCSWAVAEPTTGELLGEVGLKNLDLDAGTAEVACWTHPPARCRGIMTEAVGAAVRFGFGALDLKEVRYTHAEPNTASARLAEKCGFTLRGGLPGETEVDGEPATLMVWTLRL